MKVFASIVVAWVVLSLSLAPMTAKSAADDRVSLPAPRLAGTVSVEEALTGRRSVRSFASTELSLQEVAQLLWAAQGITHPGGLRTAPSAGALYPLEVFLVAGTVATLPPGVYRYEAKPHQLVRAASGDQRRHVAAAALRQTWIADAPVIIVISAVFKRTTRKYGDRGERYVHMEAGHAAENVCVQAVARGLGATVVGAFSDPKVKRLLGLGEEEPLLLIPVGKPE